MIYAPKLSLPRKTGHITIGIFLGITIHVLRSLFLSIVNLRTISPKLGFVDYMLGWSECISYVAFVTLALFLIHTTWHKLIHHGLIEQFMVIPENRPIYRRAVLLPLLLIFVPAVLAFSVLRFMNAFFYAGPQDVLMMIFGLLPPSSGIIYTSTLSVYHMLSIILLAIISAIPTWRDIKIPSITRNATMLTLATCIPIVIFAFEQIHLPPVIIQIIFTFILAMTVFFEVRTCFGEISPDRNKMSHIIP